jgi:hypothetical protein
MLCEARSIRTCQENFSEGSIVDGLLPRHSHAECANLGTRDAAVEMAMRRLSLLRIKKVFDASPSGGVELDSLCIRNEEFHVEQLCVFEQ